MGKKAQIRSVKKPLLGPKTLGPRIRQQENTVKLKEEMPQL